MGRSSGATMHLRVTLVIVSVVGLLDSSGFGSEVVDFSSCASSLDDVNSAAEEAAERARDAETAEEELQSEKDELEDCRSSPEIYDLLEDGCRSELQDVKGAQDELESAISDLKSALDELDSAMDNVHSACGYRVVPTSPTSGVSPAHQGMCTKLKRLKATMRSQELAALCKGVLSDAECTACLTSP